MAADKIGIFAPQLARPKPASVYRHVLSCPLF